jgi:hypothetical protein
MKNYPTIHKLYPNVSYINNKGAFDSENNLVEIDEDLVQQEYEKLEYVDKRAQEYPSIADQLDTLYHSGLDAWKAQIKTVKDKYPKA